MNEIINQPMISRDESNGNLIIIWKYNSKLLFLETSENNKNSTWTYHDPINNFYDGSNTNNFNSLSFIECFKKLHK